MFQLKIVTFEAHLIYTVHIKSTVYYDRQANLNKARKLR